MKPSAILTYHSLDDSGSVISTRPETFRAQMELLKREGAPVVAAGEIASRPGSVALTFDDGFQNFYTHAFPVLREFGFPATVFIVSGYCGGRNNWPTQSAGVPVLDLMGWSEIREVSRYGVSLGAHTVTHPHLGSLPTAEAERELRQSRAEIQDRTGVRVTEFAYPYGDWNPALRGLAARHTRPRPRAWSRA